MRTSDRHRLRPRHAAGVVALLTLPAVAPAQPTRGATPAGIVYESTGSGDPLVLLHAFSLDRRMWDPQVAAFEGRHRVVRYDLRGHGESPPPGDPYRGYDELLGVLDALGIERATLVGVSAGSQLAIDFALVHPERVARLMLAAPGLSGSPAPPMPELRPVFEAAGAGDGERAARLWAETPIMTLHHNLAAKDRVTQLVMDNWRLWTYRPSEQPLSPPAAGRLAEIRCPVLVLVGDRDQPHIRAIADRIAAEVPGAEKVVVPGAGHLLNLDAPDAFNDAVAALVAR